jgi:hypothetical protein
VIWFLSRSPAHAGSFVEIVVLICNMLGRIHMPSTVNPYLIGVWFCVGFFTGAGWAVATVIVGRILSAI